MIYELTLNGYGRTAISKRLNELGILIPTGHRAIDLKMRIPFKNNTDKVTYSWCSTTIRDILRNQMYCGDLVQNKGKLISYKIHKRVLVPQEEWIIVKDTHDAIIDRDTIFTTEYSIRTAMEAVYTLLNVDRGVSEVWGSVYDISKIKRWQKSDRYGHELATKNGSKRAFEKNRGNRYRTNIKTI